MNRPWRRGSHVALALLLGSCGAEELADAGTDAGVDAGVDAGLDAGPEPLPDCGTDSPAALAACADQARYVTLLEAIEGERPPGSAHHGEVRDLAAQTLEDLGYTVERHDYGTGVNVVGVRAGATSW